MAVADLETGKMLWNSDKYEGVTAGFGAFKSQLTKFSVTNGDVLWQTDI